MTSGARNRQRGLSVTGLIFVSIVVVLVLILGFKVVPVYMEYSTIQRLFKSMAEDPTLKGARRAEMDRAWGLRTAVDDIRSLSGDQIEYEKSPDGWQISASYSVRVPLFRNVGACFDFHPTTKQ
jgi:Domain of unknown function (DUF4845)